MFHSTSDLREVASLMRVYLFIIEFKQNFFSNRKKRMKMLIIRAILVLVFRSNMYQTGDLCCYLRMVKISLAVESQCSCHLIVDWLNLFLSNIDFCIFFQNNPFKLIIFDAGVRSEFMFTGEAFPRP